MDPTPRLATLPEIEAAIWRELAAAAADRQHPWRTPVLATVRADGSPAARTVVLREVDTPARALRVFTDSRSAKVDELGADARAVMVMWSPRLGWQLRLQARVAVETSGLRVSSRWARLQMSPAAQDYLSPLPPGAPLPGPPAPARDTRAHFAVLEARIESVDWLELHRDGHRRAVFAPEGAGWRVP